MFITFIIVSLANGNTLYRSGVVSLCLLVSLLVARPVLVITSFKANDRTELIEVNLFAFVRQDVAECHLEVAQ